MLFQCLIKSGINESYLKSKLLLNPIISPGQPISTIRSDIAQYYNMSNNIIIVGSTTDSNAAFVAAIFSRNNNKYQNIQIAIIIIIQIPYIRY